MTLPDKVRVQELADFVHGTYAEMDKLARKSPDRSISDFATERVNRALRDTRSLLSKQDTYAGDITEFVTAGQNPEVRDAVLALSEAQRAIDRVLRKYPFDPLEGF